ncbi:TetR/AcrR family transcriptional regulator [Hymenobacter metallicola]|uniref:TetR/AcrR family transcriptional regulator n=1 Tax=Hymenobacter metallicola TaxID=2563114 RepID=A0A4Z0Q9F5_9BACT|nr:helix-turn-helix domain-containing protein [Hymenobacter metallicola]TGE26660.1 TetR/AcrR family transcriptional regulator [Hymenobacter metallicola]
MNPTLRNTLLEEAVQLFQTRGISSLSLEQIMQALDISPATFREMFHDKDDLVLQVTQHDIDRQKREHAELYQRVDNAVARLLSLLEMGIRDLRKVKSPQYFSDLIQDFPRAWELGQQHLAEYSMPQIHNLLNDAILHKSMRGDINIALVSKIIIEQLYMVLNEQIFPPSRYDVAEVFRSVYLYYIRGLCTEDGLKAASTYFARM